MNLLAKPQYIFFAIAALMVLASFFFRRQTFDIHLHDTYYVISRPTYFFVLATMLILLGILYVFFSGVMGSGLLTWIHIGVTVIAMLAAVVIPLLQPADRPTRYIDYSDSTPIRMYATYNSWLVIMLMVMVFAQLALIVNIGLGVMRAFNR
jgi:heme/copper-type cytochrome/quinol oxidase subunit 1